MPVPSPASEAVTLFNELVSLPWSESARIRQIEVRLRRLFELRSDIVTGLGLSQARAMLGMYDEANQMMPWLLKEIADADAVSGNNLVGLACDLGHFDAVMDLADDRLELSRQGAIAAFFAGKAEKLEQFAIQINDRRMLHWLEKLATANLTALFSDIQTATREVMAGKFTACGVSLSPVDEDSAGTYYTWLEKAQRRNLEYDLDRMTHSIAERHGSSWCDMPLVTMILPLGAHPGKGA